MIIRRQSSSEPRSEYSRSGMALRCLSLSRRVGGEARRFTSSAGALLGLVSVLPGLLASAAEQHVDFVARLSVERHTGERGLAEELEVAGACQGLSSDTQDASEGVERPLRDAARVERSLLHLREVDLRLGLTP